MHISDHILDTIRSNGFAVVEDFLTAEELAVARCALFSIYPSPEEYFADPERYAHLVRHAFAGLRLGPVDSWEINRLSFHPDLVDAASRFCGTDDIEIYKIELWAKYSGSVDYDQEHHRDYNNHSLVVPRADGRWPQLTTFLLLSDVDDEDGPTKVLPGAVNDTMPRWPHMVEDGDSRENEIAITGPAGSLFLYTTDHLHRGSAITGQQRSRFSLLTDYQARGNPWMGKMSWPGRATVEGWSELLARATPRERELFGFPPVGSEYWNEQTLHDVALRWPLVDISAYRS